jgi:hypothetical protein
VRANSERCLVSQIPAAAGHRDTAALPSLRVEKTLD